VEPVPKISVSGCKFSFGVSHSWQFSADKTETAFGGELEGSDIVERIQEMLDVLQVNSAEVCRNYGISIYIYLYI